MSHSKHHRRRTGFGMEMLETRKLAAIIGPPNAGIEDLGADVVDTTVNPHADPLIHAQLTPTRSSTTRSCSPTHSHTTRWTRWK